MVAGSTSERTTRLTLDDYAEFLARKAVRVEARGFPAPDLHPRLFPFQRHLVEWALQRGRAAIFADCGLGKSWMALEWARCVAERAVAPVLILTPLAVAQKFVAEAQKLGIVCKHVRELGEIGRAGIYVTNYERLDKFADHCWGGVVLDESSILKNFNGKTRTALIECFRETPYRLCCTATPSPNDVAELGNHAEFLGISRHVDMLNRFFEHDAGDTGEWKLKGHARKPFWRWVAQWAQCVGKPSDIGFSDDGYDLPELLFREHVVELPREVSRAAGMLFAYEAATLSEQRAVRRASISARVAAAALAIAKDIGEQWIVWCSLNEESEAMTAVVPWAREITGSDSSDKKEAEIGRFLCGDTRVLVTKQKICALGLNMQCCARQLFVGVDYSHEAFYQAVRRSWRFGQTRPVEVHLVRTDADGKIIGALRRKQEDAETMKREMREAMKSV
jgi:hypothetical protein